MSIFKAIDDQTLNRINEAICSIGPAVKLYIVGGAVRDKLLGIDSKDIDFVVTQMPFDNADDALESIYSALKPIVDKVNKVGEAFGIVTATINGFDFDFAIPRRKETKTGNNHTDFDVDLDPQAPIETDLSRRDFTINAMAMTTEGLLIDPLHGSVDLTNGVIKAVGDPDARIKEDPLRILRAIQFACRFSDFVIDTFTLKSIILHHELLKHVSGERILAEYEKAWTKGVADIDLFIFYTDIMTGINNFFFGDTFLPMSVTIEGTDHERKIARFVGMFFNGGEKEFLKIHGGLPNYYTDALKVFREIVSGDKKPYEFIGPHKDKLSLFDRIAFSSRMVLGMEPVKYVRRMMKVPIIAKDLALGGEDIMILGYKGKDIGLAQKEILSAIWAGEINNTKEDIKNYLVKGK